MVAVDRKSNQIVLIQHAAKWLICIDLVFARVVKHNNRAFALSTEPAPARQTRFTPARLLPAYEKRLWI
jgi:hypothetical protein